MSHAPTPPLSGDGPARMSSYFEALNVLTHLFRVFNRRESHATRGIEAGVAINRNKLMALILDYVIFWHSPQRPTSYLDIFFRSLKRDDFALNFSLGGSLRFLKKRGGEGGGGEGNFNPKNCLWIENCVHIFRKSLHCTALRCFALLCVALRCFALLCVALRCTALHYFALYCFALHYTALHCIALYCTALHCTAYYKL